MSLKKKGSKFNVQNYILTQQVENTVKKTEYNLNVNEYNEERKVGLLVFFVLHF